VVDRAMLGTDFKLLSALFQDRPMVAIWSERALIETSLRTEAELAQAQADAGVIGNADVGRGSGEQQATEGMTAPRRR